MLASAKLLAIDNSIRCRVGWGNLNEEKISTFADNYLDNYRKLKVIPGARPLVLNLAVASKLLRVFYAMLTKGVDYDPKKMISDIKRPEDYLQAA